MLSYRLKVFLFPEYGSQVPSEDEISPISKGLSWGVPAIPNWVLDEMKDLARDIDPILYPTDQFLIKCQYYSFPVLPDPGKVYRNLMQNCSSDHYTHCFAIPWLKRGGADLVILKHVELSACIPGGKVLIIITEPGESPWLSRIPAGVDVIDASRFVGDVSHNEFILILTRILVQLHINTLHIINSRHIWEVVCRYGLAISQKSNIFASIYCDDFDKNGRPEGFARQYLPECYYWLTNVFSDNNAFPELLRRTYGYRPELFRVLKSPVDASLSLPPLRQPQGRRVLWAGRLDHQKRPDLLLAIAQIMPDVEFHIYGDALLNQKTHTTDGLKKLKNVHMLGAFDGVESLPFNLFPVFLYTSQWDGTPTMEIAAAIDSIPIVASRVGGVGDIVNEDRGYPISDIENIEFYALKINEALSNRLYAEKKAAAAREYVMNEHSEAKFFQILEATPGYMSKVGVASSISKKDIE